MTTLELNGQTYQIGQLPAKTQFHIARRITPVFSAIAEAAPRIAAAGEADSTASFTAFMEPVGEVLAGMDDAQVDYVLDACLAAVKRLSGDRYAPVTVNKQLMFNDINMTVMLRLTVAVIQENLGDFFGAGPVEQQ